MIGFFPDPYPDELFSSIYARYHQRMHYRSRDSTIRDLFGSTTLNYVIDLPNHLGHLMERLPPGHRYTVDRIVDQHTLFPFYTPFMPPGQACRVREGMRANKSYIIRFGTWDLKHQAHMAWLRFCRPCAEEDRKRFGETYWHRLHQLPGVLVCPVHQVFLLESNLHMRYRRSRQVFLSADQAVQNGSVRTLDRSKWNHEVLLKIASDAAWLLCNPGLNADSRMIHTRYLELLFDRGFATYVGRLYTRKILEAFQGYYPTDVLQALHCELEKRKNWLTRLLESAKAGQHPLYHLLLMQWLGCPSEKFFKLSERSHPFGESPWPCLNRASDHFGQDRILNCEITYRPKGFQEPVGTFRCSCGFAYSREGPDQNTECRHQMTKIKSFGVVWEKVLIDLFQCGTASVNEMARRLGVSPFKIRRQAVRLGLMAKPSDDHDMKTGSSHSHPAGRKRTVITPAVLEAYRSRWRRALEESPGASRSAIRQKVHYVFEWLRKNDAEWFQAHLPPCKKGRKLPANWAARDIELAAAVKAIAPRIKCAPGRPVRVSPNAIAIELGQPSAFHKHEDRLPLTMSALAEVTESTEAYAVVESGGLPSASGKRTFVLQSGS